MRHPRRTFNAPGHSIHKLAVTMQRSARKTLQGKELECRRALYTLHPQGPAAAAAQESAHVRQLASFDAEQSQLLLQAAGAPVGVAEAAAPAVAVRQQPQSQQQARVLPPSPEQLSAAHLLWDVDQPPHHPQQHLQQQQRRRPQHVVPLSDAGLLFRLQASHDVAALLQHSKQAAQYQPYAAAAGDAVRGVQQQRKRQQPQQPPQQQQQPPQQQRQRQRQAAPLGWQKLLRPLSLRCSWLYTRMQELQSVVTSLEAPGQQAAAEGQQAGSAPSGAGGAAAGKSLQLQAQRHGCLLRQHVDAVALGSIAQAPLFARDAAAAAAVPSGAAPGAAAVIIKAELCGSSAGRAGVAQPPVAADGMEVDGGQPQGQQQAQAAAAAGAPPAPAAGARRPPQQLPAGRRAPAYVRQQHACDPALLFAGLELVERQLVAARLALGHAFSVDAQYAPPGVRLGQYAASRLLVGPDGALLDGGVGGRGGGGGGGVGSKRGAGGAGLVRGGGARSGGLLRSDSVGAGLFKRRRLAGERSSMGAGGGSAFAGGGNSMLLEDDGGVVSPTASSRLVERLVRERERESVCVCVCQACVCVRHVRVCVCQACVCRWCLQRGAVCPGSAFAALLTRLAPC
jgi:hypothetical protein